MLLKYDIIIMQLKYIWRSFMAKETTTVQCYPSDSAVNRKIREYEAFGWELINNQRCNEDKGTYGGCRHYSTFNKLTFTR